MKFNPGKKAAKPKRTKIKKKSRLTPFFATLAACQAMTEFLSTYDGNKCLQVALTLKTPAPRKSIVVQLGCNKCVRKVEWWVIKRNGRRWWVWRRPAFAWADKCVSLVFEPPKVLEKGCRKSGWTWYTQSPPSAPIAHSNLWVRGEFPSIFPYCTHTVVHLTRSIFLCTFQGFA